MSFLDMEIPDQEFTPELHAAGWAPGQYMCKCADCGKTHQADKRASRCVSCARTAWDEYQKRQETIAAIDI